jgi:hypothetical protein
MATCSSPPIPDKNGSGDNWYGQDICRQDMIDYFWTTYGFNGNKAYWENGWGWHDPCNTDLPLARTFNAAYALTYSAQDYLNDAWDAPQNILQWGRRFVRESIGNLRANCGDGTADASERDGNVQLFLGYFFNEAVPERASTLCHESRHVGGHPHNAKFPKDSVYGEGEDGADSNWEYQGAWAFDAAYAAWYGVEGARTTSALKALSRQIANKILNNAFATHPGVNV